MNDEDFQKRAEFLNIMANAQRLKMLTTLSDGEISVGPLAEKLGMSQSALSQHLGKLRASDMVSTRREAQTVYYSVKSENVAVVLAMLDEIFTARLPEHRIAS
jgi:DNA-binding transcriptional ArsR family regulator